MILVPVKNLNGAKQRLSSILDPPERVELAHAMCEDVLGAIAAWQGRPPVTVVTSDPYARSLARHFAFDVIADETNSSETDAIQMATNVCCAQDVESLLVVPADIPMIETAELEQIAAAAPERGTVLVPDAAGRGTNAAWKSPAGLFPLRFGNDSFLPHQAAARATGLPCVVLQLPGIALDVDRPDDLLALASAHGSRRSQKLARSWNLEQRKQACHG